MYITIINEAKYTLITLIISTLDIFMKFLIQSLNSISQKMIYLLPQLYKGLFPVINFNPIKVIKLQFSTCKCYR